MVCIPLSDRAVCLALLSLQSVTTFVICCMRQELEESLRMPFQSRVRSSTGKYLPHPEGMTIRSPDLNPIAPTRPSHIRETHEFRTESVIEDQVRFSALPAAERACTIGRMSVSGLRIAWSGNIPAWMPSVLGNEQSGYVWYTRRRISSKEIDRA
ncbi:uncharacterized protein BO87DRAFT_401929 [Aspergillus neoniger CBS 115656]|uniref:Secreted protein n=1 Tax=Aspergillus neoniger (strain CBS 115656) TaxID=1448310 RepID=A0A318Y4X2_ASPNB|nr:hypothetical protein BO87DRAFT_401929 [Aspergillus neoniger CBS 115656]PYH28824.1 hypothetical protein BO87DRAFT_401929 [Aspergillus neoniger CBS 115656]